jgi:2-amino-4-hydroxy-6-hydroxymethyldihydropteridine diphosphokinase
MGAAQRAHEFPSYFRVSAFFGIWACHLADFALVVCRQKSQNGNPMSNCAYLSLGSNLGDREANLREAIQRLATVGKVLAVSSFYETEPIEYTAQDWFLNCALVLETGKMPLELLKSVLDLEQSMGRRRVQDKGPRNIDIDVLLFDDSVVNSKGLTIPHPAMHQRRFVLEPLAEIAPDARHPVLKKTVRELLEALPPGQIVRKLPPKTTER